MPPFARRRLLAVALLAAGLPVGARAQPVAPAPTERAPIPPAVAVGVSLGATTVAVGTGMLFAGSDDGRAVLVALGLTAAPSLGNLVQGERADAAIGLGIRTAGAALVVGAVASSLTASTSEDADGLVAMGGLVILSGVAYDAVTAGLNARARRVEVTPAGAGLALRVGL